jgi:hypothetical protein
MLCGKRGCNAGYLRLARDLQPGTRDPGMAGEEGANADAKATAWIGAAQGDLGAGEGGGMNESDEDPAQRERRSDPRELAALHVVRLIHATGSQLCRIRNLSSRGAMAEATADYRPGDRIDTELLAGECTSGIVIWAEQGRVGIAFDEPVDPLAILAKVGERQSLRLPRHSVAADVRLCVGARDELVRAEDISVSGIKVVLDGFDCVGASVIVMLDGFPPLAGTVQWQHGGHAGIAFDQPIDSDMLAFWLTTQS